MPRGELKGRSGELAWALPHCLQCEVEFGMLTARVKIGLASSRFPHVLNGSPLYFYYLVDLERGAFLCQGCIHFLADEHIPNRLFARKEIPLHALRVPHSSVYPLPSNSE